MIRYEVPTKEAKVHTCDDRAKPMKYIARSHGNRRVQKQIEKVFGHNPEIISAVLSGEFTKAWAIAKDDGTLNSQDLRILLRWIRVESRYREDFKTPLPS